MSLRTVDVYGSGTWYEARPWQRDVIDIIKDEPTEFNLVVVVDCSDVGAGKSHLCKHYDKYINHTLDYTGDQVCVVSLESLSAERNSTQCARRFNLTTKLLLIDGPHCTLQYPPVRFLRYLKDQQLRFRGSLYDVLPVNVVLMSRVWTVELSALNPKRVIFLHSVNSPRNLVKSYVN